MPYCSCIDFIDILTLRRVPSLQMTNFFLSANSGIVSLGKSWSRNRLADSGPNPREKNGFDFFWGVGALDYHPGHVLPFAINLGAAQYADDSKIVLPKITIFSSVQKLSNFHKGPFVPSLFYQIQCFKLQSLFYMFTKLPLTYFKDFWKARNNKIDSSLSFCALTFLQQMQRPLCIFTAS